MSDILMPKATAVWLLDNTSLTFAQIADFCGLHYLEVKGIADGDVAENMRGVDPIAGGMLSREEIRRGEADDGYKLKMAASKIAHIPQPKRKGSRYTPVIRRQDKPDAVAWFIRNHPEVSDAQISKLIGTTKSTINNV
ncbi:MAG: cell cycle transcriptional regulator TrcR, partial [Hyphomonas sp.]|nr:cell cycle transcriptional regulator TrcR [Hyphomonas sp.]